MLIFTGSVQYTCMSFVSLIELILVKQCFARFDPSHLKDMVINFYTP